MGYRSTSIPFSIPGGCKFSWLAGVCGGIGHCCHGLQFGKEAQASLFQSLANANSVGLRVYVGALGMAVKGYSLAKASLFQPLANANSVGLQGMWGHWAWLSWTTVWQRSKGIPFSTPLGCQRLWTAFQPIEKLSSGRYGPDAEQERHQATRRKLDEALQQNKGLALARDRAQSELMLKDSELALQKAEAAKPALKRGWSWR